MFRSLSAVCLLLIFVASSVAAENDYSHWPAYQKTPAGEIVPQKWRTTDDIIDGWDFSLPPTVKVSKKSLLCLSRNINQLPSIKFPANPVVSLWVRWRQLEPEENRYRFDKLIEDVKKAEKAGYGVIIRPMTAAWESLAYPDATKTTEKMRNSKKCAPDYLVQKYDVPKIKEKPKHAWRIVNLDVTHRAFHQRYIKFVEALGRSSIPMMENVKGFIVGYASSSWGDEGIGPHKQVDPPHVKQRLDAWAKACEGVEHKVCLCGDSPYGFEKGFGVRGGFVEMYLYQLPNPAIGQELDKDDYIIVNEESPIIKNGAFSGDENEEYEEKWTHRFGPLESFTYRYFTSSLRLIQMRRNYLLHNPFSVYPDMLPYVSLQMGRTVKDTPDVWCFMRESYLRKTPCRNFERWLYQRDRKGFETEPAVKIKMPIKMWMVQKDRTYDFVARRGKKIGFAVDNRFLSGGPNAVAFKISYFDTPAGTLNLCYQTPKGVKIKKVELKNTGKVRTATFFVNDAVFGAKKFDYDLTIESSVPVTVSIVRIIKGTEH